MPKKGKPNSYWDDLMRKYAKGEHRFSTGQKPGGKRWKEVLNSIDNCPRHKRSGLDLFGRTLQCKCGYHEPEQLQDTSHETAISTGAEPTTSTGIQPSSIRLQLEFTRTQPTSTGSQPLSTRPQQTSKCPVPKTIVCGLCKENVDIEEYQQHLLEWHADIECEQCHTRVRGELELATHVDTYHACRSTDVTCLPPAMSTPRPVLSAQPLSVKSPSRSSVTPAISTSRPVISTQPVSVSSTPRSSVTPIASTSRPVLSAQPVSVSSTPQPSGTPVASISRPVLSAQPVSVSSTPRSSVTPVASTSLPVLSARPVSVSSTPRSSVTPVASTSRPLLPAQPVSVSSTPQSSVTPTTSTSRPVISAQPVSVSSTPRSYVTPTASTSWPVLSAQPVSVSSTPRSSVTPVASTSRPVLSARPVSVSSTPRSSLTAAMSTTSTPQLTITATVLPPVQQTLTEWESFLPNKFKKYLLPGDKSWIAQCLYNSNGQLKDTLPDQNWYFPPNPLSSSVSPPDPLNYFRQKMFLWAPMRMWQIPLKCPSCGMLLSHSGIYPKVREVVDLDSRYYLVGADYPRCNKCKLPQCPWNPDVLKQLDPGHRNLFPAVLTKNGALDRKCVTLMKPRTQGNSSSYIQQALHELHSEEWGKRCIQYLSDCELHMKGTLLTGAPTVPYKKPPLFRPLPLAQWFQTAHTNEILGHAEEMVATITSTYGRILKLDSTKKITKKLAGDFKETASWMTNIANEHGQVLNSVLTTGEGPALDALCQGIVARYREAKEPAPQVIYVDRDCCCTQSGNSPVLEWFRPWTCKVRLDIFHYMRRFTRGLTTEHHPLYGTFCSKLSSCIFIWDHQDYALLREAKKGELRMKHHGMPPTEKQVTAAISSSELARHCRRRTRDKNDIKQQINKLLEELWDRTDSAGLRLINAESMTHVWAVQERHLECIQDPPDVDLYTIIGTVEKGGKILNVLKCARGSSSLESFHRHQCTFVPGWNANAIHMQMYMLEGGSRWNMNRGRDAVDLAPSSQTRMYDIRLMSAINTLSQKVLSVHLLPEFVPPGKATDELIAVDYLLAQSGKGDLRPSQKKIIKDDDDGQVLPEVNAEEAKEEDLQEDDQTISKAEDIEKQMSVSGESDVPIHMSECEICGVQLNTGQMVVHMVTHMTSEQGPPSHTVKDVSVTYDTTGSPAPSDSPTTIQPESPEPLSELVASTEQEETRLDAQGYPGWEKIDALAAYLVELDTTLSTALSRSETDRIVELYSKLQDSDKVPTKYSLKTKKDVLPGPWRASRKRQGTSPGVQASERLYMTHGQAAQCPSSNRISECVCLRLMRLFQQARNRPKDVSGKTLPLAQSIVQRYSMIQMLLADSRKIQEETDLLLVTVNNTTVSTWVNRRQKRMDREGLLQGTNLVESVSTSKDPLPKAKDLPTTQTRHAHQLLTFSEPENRQGQSKKRPYKKSTPAASTPNDSMDTAEQTDFLGRTPDFHHLWQPRFQEAPVYPPFSSPHGPQGWYGWPYCMPPFGPPHHPSVQASAPSYSYQEPSESTPPHTISSRQRDWRHRKAMREDQDDIAKGITPKKRYKKAEHYRYLCSVCKKQKNSETGHTQIRGKWYCPALGITVEEWKRQLLNI